MIAYLIAHLVLSIYNPLNAKYDSRRIMLGKQIYHGLNFGVYTLLVAGLCLLCRFDFRVITLFLISAYCNRQLTFDIPLNLLRGLKWDYVTKAKPPKAITDRVEIWLFGYNGRAPVIMYAAIWAVCLIIKIFI